MRSITIPLRLLVVGALLLGSGAGTLGAQRSAADLVAGDPDPWPREFETSRFLVRLFPPQVDSWDGLRLDVHSAVEVVERAHERTLFGVVYFKARTQVDKAARMVVIDEITGLQASFPSAPEKAGQLLSFLQQQVKKGVRVVSLDRLEAAYAAVGFHLAVVLARRRLLK